MTEADGPKAHVALERLIRLDDRVAVVTGAARGIGLAIAERLAEAGASVAIGDIDEREAARAATRISDAGGRCLSGRLDVTDADSLARFAADTSAHFGRIDIWVNNAGIYPPRAFLDMSERDWDMVCEVNLKGAFLGARIAAEHMAPPRGAGGVILFIASVSGLRGRPNLAHYTASKHGVVGLTKALGIELAPMGIRVLALAPTLILTPGVAAAQAGNGGKTDDAYRAFVGQVAASIPLGRAGEPDDVARVALFCVSDLAAFLTGSTIPVDGGATA